MIKLIITSTLKLETGLHIGTSDTLYGIGTVDSVVLRDPLTKEPIIPGSSLKGKIRAMIGKEDPISKKLFGCSESKKPSRFQFWDCFLRKESSEKLKKLTGSLYMTEIKFENSIDEKLRANPRQIERVPRGAEFDFKVIYTIDKKNDEKVKIDGEIENDLKIFKEAITFLTYDYLGGSGSRGYGKVSFGEFTVSNLNFTLQGAQIINSPLIPHQEYSNILNFNNLKGE